MNVLKFQLSVIFAKTNLNPLSSNELIIDSIREIFKEEVKEEELNIELSNIISENMNSNNNFIIEFPEDYTLNDI